MQGQDTQKSNNVVSLFSAREKAKSTEAEVEAKEPENQESFADVMNRNQKNKERLEKERASANKSVLRSYRIKH